MALLEALTLGLSASVVKSVVKLWLKENPVQEGLAGGVVDILKSRFDDFKTRRASERLFMDIQDNISRRLEKIIATEFTYLPENEQVAATVAVSGILENTSLTQDLFRTNLD